MNKAAVWADHWHAAEIAGSQSNCVWECEDVWKGDDLETIRKKMWKIRYHIMLVKQ
jgi:hypothetical protein